MISTQNLSQSNNQKSSANLKLYIYGSCQSDQYYHPSGLTESKRPICLSDIENLKILNDQSDQKGQNKTSLIPNPLFKSSILKIATGALHTIALTTEGKVFTFGCNDEGALGREGIQNIPIQVAINEPIDLISAGDNHSVFGNSLTGSIYFTGNYKYMRGQKMADPIKTPIKLNISDIDVRSKNQIIEKLVSGSNHTCILVAGRIYVRGQPQAHTVGRRINARNKIRNSLNFDGVGLTNVVDVWCGGYHSFAKVKKGSSFVYYAWGLNKHGQLGVRNYEQSPYPEQVKNLRGKNIIHVGAGTNFTIVLTDAGDLYGCGQNDDGQLALGENYEYQDSEAEEQSKRLSADFLKKMLFNSQEVQGAVEIQKDSENEKNPEKQEINEIKKDINEQINEQIKEQSPIKKLKEQNVYIKSFKKIKLEEKVTHITSGSEFSLAWNEKSLYTWGFGMNYVLLNGEQEDQYTPFKVKPKIINQQMIYDIAAGAQHVAYLSYPDQSKIEVKLSEKAKQASQEYATKQKLSRKRK